MAADPTLLRTHHELSRGWGTPMRPLAGGTEEKVNERPVSAEAKG